MLIVKFYPLLSHNVIDSFTTMVSADLSKQAFSTSWKEIPPKLPKHKTNRHVRKTSSDKGIVCPSYIDFSFLVKLKENLLAIQNS